MCEKLKAMCKLRASELHFNLWPRRVGYITEMCILCKGCVTIAHNSGGFECHGQMINTPASYSGDTGFKYWP
jgi:hypothetical protein